MDKCASLTIRLFPAVIKLGKKNRKCRKFNPVAVKAEMQALVSESSTDKDVIRGFSCSPGG